MNPALVATFASAADSALLALGGPLTLTRAAGGTLAVRGVVRKDAAPVGDFGERMESRYTLQVAASSAAVVGDAFAVAGGAVWRAVQLLADNGVMLTFAVLEETP